MAACPPGPDPNTVTVCSPASDATVQWPFRVDASSTSASPVVAMQVYVDFKLVYQTPQSTVDTLIDAPLGFRRIAVQAWNSAGQTFKREFSVTVVPCPLGSTNPSVTICSPAPFKIFTSPMRVVAGTTSTKPIVATQVYVNHAFKAQQNSSVFDGYVDVPVGKHNVQIKAWANDGTSFFKNIVVQMTPGCTLPSTEPAVGICTPAISGVTTPQKFRVYGAGKTTKAVTMNLAINGINTSITQGPVLDRYLDLVPGTHRLKLEMREQNVPVASKEISVQVKDNSGLANLRHIIFYMNENRSADNYFGRFGQYRADRGLPPDWDALPLTVAHRDLAGDLVSPYPFRTVCHENLSPSWNESHGDENGGLMDRFMQTAKSIPSSIDPHGTRAMGYYDWNALPYYYDLAFKFATSDRFYSSVMSGTYPNRMYLFGGTSLGHVYQDPRPPGGWPNPTIFDRLEDAGINWAYYYQDSGILLGHWASYSRLAYRLRPIEQWYTDVQNEATFPQVAFIERPAVSGLDEHPGENIQLGAARTREILEGLMRSPSWGSSVFMLLYDEGGGLHDHVWPIPMLKPDDIAPLLRAGDYPGDFERSGFRVPFILVSPWAKKNYVSHTWRDITSVLKLIEDRFGLSGLSFRDQAADNMLEFFDFTAPSYPTAPAMAAQPTNAPCDFNLQNAPGH